MERDFLFCVLAVQTGLASPAQVMAAASAALADSSLGLRQRLLRDGALRPDQDELLDQMVAAALEAHGQDVKQTLHSLGGERALFKSFGGSLAASMGGALAPLAETQVGDSVDGALRVTSEEAGRYELRGTHREGAEIGRGGIGRVLVTFDTHLGREIALKELLPDNAGARPSAAGSGERTQALVARFLREARVTGQLEHPSIVPVYELGQRADGTYYYAMKLVRGRTLAQALAECKTPGERLKLLPRYADLCHAVAYAHSRGVIHRDIKTDNVMVGEFGETVVLDWGLAKVKGKQDIRGSEIEHEIELLQDGGSGHTIAGSALGTPAYMSPEQADGAIDEVDERSDVWSLGAVLFELLTGRPPFEGATPFEIIGKVLKSDIPPATAIEPRCPPELAGVAAKALQRDKALRYQSAKLLGEETDAYLSGGRVAAYRYGPWELLRGFVAQNRALSLLVLAIAGLVVTGSFVLLGAYRQADREKGRAQQSEQRAQQEKERSQRNEQAAELNLAAAFEEKAERLYEERSVLAARIYAAAALVHHPCRNLGLGSAAECDERFPGGSALHTRAVSSVYQAGLSILARPDWTERSETMLYRLDASADGSLLATLGDDAKVRVHDGKTHRLLATLDGFAGARNDGLAVSPDGATIAVCDSERSIALYDRTGKRLGALALAGGEGRYLAFSPTGTVLGAASADGTITLWDVDRKKQLHVLAAARPSQRPIAFSWDGTLLAAGGRDGVTLWDTRSGRALRTIENLRGASRMAFSPDGQRLAVGTVYRTVVIAEVSTGTILKTLLGHGENVRGVSFSPNGSLLVTASSDTTLRFWNAKSFELQYLLRGHAGPVSDARVVEGGKRVVSVGEDGTLRSWAIAQTPTVPVLRGHASRSWDLSFSPDGSVLASAGDDGTVRLWNARTGAARGILSEAETSYHSVSFSADGKLLAAGRSPAASGTGGIEIWDVASRRRIKVVGSSEQGWSATRWSPDAQRLASCHTGGTNRLWDATTGSQIRVVEKDGAGQSYPAFSPDGRWLATGGADKTVRLSDGATGEHRHTLRGHADIPYCFAFSEDGKQMLSGGKHGRLLLWDVATRTRVRELEGHARWVNSVAFVPHSPLVVSASDEGTVRLWSADTGENLLIIQVTGEGMSAVPSPDGKTLAVIDDRVIKLYPIDLSLRDEDPERLLAQAESEAGLKLHGFALEPQ